MRIYLSDELSSSLSQSQDIVEEMRLDDSYFEELYKIIYNHGNYGACSGFVKFHSRSTALEEKATIFLFEPERFKIHMLSFYKDEYTSNYFIISDPISLVCYSNSISIFSGEKNIKGRILVNLFFEHLDIPIDEYVVIDDLTVRDGAVDCRFDRFYHYQNFLDEIHQIFDYQMLGMC